MKATVKGKKDVIISQVDGRTTCDTLDPVKYCKQAKGNLFSLISALSKEGVLRSDDQKNIVINQDDINIVFDRQIKTCDSWMCRVNMFPSEVQSIEYDKYDTLNIDSIMMREVEVIQRNKNSKHARKITELLQHKGSLIRKGETRDINEYHNAFGLNGNQHVLSHAEGILSNGKFNCCEDCTLGKARQANVSKNAVPRSTNNGYQLFLDVSSPITKSMCCK